MSIYVFHHFYDLHRGNQAIDSSMLYVDDWTFNLRVSHWMDHRLCVVMLFFVWSSSMQAIACMPHVAQDVFIARYDGTQAVQHQNNNVFNLRLHAEKFIFRSFLDRFRYAEAEDWHSTSPMNTIPKNTLIIGLAYAPDGEKPQDYQVASWAKLSCNNDRLAISEPMMPFTAWDRKTHRCAHTDVQSNKLLDGFFDHDHAYYVAKLQQKYPTCQQLNTAFPNLINTAKHHNSQSVTWWNSMWRKYGF